VDRETHRDVLITILCNLSAGKVITPGVMKQKVLIRMMSVITVQST